MVRITGRLLVVKRKTSGIDSSRSWMEQKDNGAKDWEATRSERKD